jgi:hypothetical protein
MQAFLIVKPDSYPQVLEDQADRANIAPLGNVVQYAFTLSGQGCSYYDR